MKHKAQSVFRLAMLAMALAGFFASCTPDDVTLPPSEKTINYDSIQNLFVSTWRLKYNSNENRESCSKYDTNGRHFSWFEYNEDSMPSYIGRYAVCDYHAADSLLVVKSYDELEEYVEQDRAQLKLWHKYGKRIFLLLWSDGTIEPCYIEENQLPTKDSIIYYYINRFEFSRPTGTIVKDTLKIYPPSDPHTYSEIIYRRK